MSALSRIDLAGVYRMHTIIVAIFVLTPLLFFFGCTGLTEYELPYSGALYILSPDDFSVIREISDIPEARSLLVYPDGLLIATTRGMIRSYSLGTYDLIGEFTVGSESPAGYSQMAYSSTEETAYLIGSMGKLLEIDLPGCEVLDEFSVCQSPIELVVPDNSSYIFVCDGPSNRLYQLSIENNYPYTSVPVYFIINCFEPGQNPDSMLLGTSRGINLVEILAPGVLRNTILDEPVPCLALAAVPGDTIFVGVKGYPGDYSVGIVDVINSQVHVPPLPEYYGQVGITGNSHFLSMATDSTHAFVLSSIGESASRLISYNCSTYTVDQQIDLPGFPLDLKVSEDGIIHALTTE